MDAINYTDAWAAWWNEVDVRDHALWGVKILWWGRIGKVIQFFAATLIVIEIIGPTRLRLWGNSLHGMLDVRRAARLAKATAIYLGLRILGYTRLDAAAIELATSALKALPSGLAGVDALLAGLSSQLEGILPRVRQYFKEYFETDPDAGWVLRQVRLANVLVSAALLIGVIWVGLYGPAAGKLPAWFVVVLAVIASTVFFATIGLFVAALSVLLSVSIGIILDVAIIEPLAWIMERPSLGTFVKVLSFVVFVIGFQFDLVAS